jgi:F-type H+-transporting ATPase subunit delta
MTDTQVATLRSAVKLEQEQQFLIAKKLQELTGSKNIKLKPIIDQSLIAGFVVEYGSSQIDLSIRGQIEKVAEEKGKLEAVHADVDSVAALVKDNQKLRELLYNPVVEGAKKKAVIAKITKEAGFQKYTSNFLNILVEKDRLGLLGEICESFEEQYCELTDTQVATLRSAVKLEQEQQFLIAKKLQELTNSKNIKLKPVIDPSLIAGFVVEYGSSQIDLSIRGQIEKVAEELTKQMATATA